jgi:hypothetical protein
VRFQSGCYSRTTKCLPSALARLTELSVIRGIVGYADLTPFARSFIVIECAALFRSCGLRIGRERRVSDRAAQKIEGLFERAIVLFVGRHVGLRA